MKKYIKTFESFDDDFYYSDVDEFEDRYGSIYATNAKGGRTKLYVWWDKEDDTYRIGINGTSLHRGPFNSIYELDKEIVRMKKEYSKMDF